MGFQSFDSTYPLPEESVIVVIDANRSRPNVDAVDWAIKYIVRPKDTVVVLVVLSEIGKRPSSSCFDCGIRLSGIRLTKIHLPIFVIRPIRSFIRGEIRVLYFSIPSQLEEEIERKKDEFRSTLRPFYRQCKKNGVKLEVKLAAGFDPKQITVEQAHHHNPCWIVIDSNLKKHKVHVYEHVACNVAVMKSESFATLMLSKAPIVEQRLIGKDCKGGLKSELVEAWKEIPDVADKVSPPPES